MSQNIGENDKSSTVSKDKEQAELEIEVAKKMMKMILSVDHKNVILTEPDFSSCNCYIGRSTLALIRDIVLTMTDEIFDVQLHCAVFDIGVFVFVHDPSLVENKTVKEGLLSVDEVKNNTINTEIIIDDVDVEEIIQDGI